MSEVTASGLYAAEHRAYRELHASTRQLESHWGKLALRLDDDFLAEGASQAGALLAGLEQRIGSTYDLHGPPSAPAPRAPPAPTAAPPPRPPPAPSRRRGPPPPAWPACGGSATCCSNATRPSAPR